MPPSLSANSNLYQKVLTPHASDGKYSSDYFLAAIDTIM